MTIDRPELKPCPFCTGMAVMDLHDGLTVTVRCKRKGCHAKIERGVVNSRTVAKAKAMVEKAWERRDGVETVYRPLRGPL